MSNKKTISSLIKSKIALSIPKDQIRTELLSKYKEEEFKKILKDYPEPELKNKYKKLNNLLIFSIILYTLFKLFIFIGNSNSLLLEYLLFIIIINITISSVLIYYLKTFRATGFILAIIAGALPIGQFFNNVNVILSSGDIFVIGFYFLYMVTLILNTVIPIYLFKKIYPNYYKK